MRRGAIRNTQPAKVAKGRGSFTFNFGNFMTHLFHSIDILFSKAYQTFVVVIIFFYGSACSKKFLKSSHILKIFSSSKFFSNSKNYLKVERFSHLHKFSKIAKIF